jgi:hypothetical protein
MPNNNLGRDEMWSEPVWQEIDNAVLREVGRIKVSQKVFPSSQSPNGQYVPADEFDTTQTFNKGGPRLSSKFRSLLPLFCRFLRFKSVPRVSHFPTSGQEYIVLTTVAGSPANAQLMRAYYDSRQ